MLIICHNAQGTRRYPFHYLICIVLISITNALVQPQVSEPDHFNDEDYSIVNTSAANQLPTDPWKYNNLPEQRVKFSTFRRPHVPYEQYTDLALDMLSSMILRVGFEV